MAETKCWPLAEAVEEAAGGNGEGTPEITSPAVPWILVSFDEKRVADEAIQAIASAKNLYQRGTKLVQIVHDTKPPKGIARPEGSPRISVVKLPRLREIMAANATWGRPGDKEEDDVKLCHVPRWAVEAVAARDQWTNIRPLEGVVESPVLRRDGSVLATAGYDASTGLVLSPRSDYPPVPTKSTKDDAIQACQSLVEVVEDFPFASTTHEAAWVAATLTPFARFAFHGPAPLALIDANVRGSGKSLLADVTGTIFSWRGMSRMTAPKDDDEFRKRITALALAGDNLILIDNITGTLGGPSLSAALTATSWSDRVLGRSEMVSGVPLVATWYATANNAILGPDMARRLLHIRLESPDENPEERTGFRHPKLLEWVRQEQPRLAVAAVTILAAYCRAGRPDMGLTPWGSFGAWSDLVRAAVVWIGMPDPGETRGELATTADSEANALRMFIAALDETDPERDGLTVREMLRLIDGDESRHEALRAAIGELAPTRGDKTPSARSLAMKLHHLRRRVVGERFLDSQRTKMGALWTVHRK